MPGFERRAENGEDGARSGVDDGSPGRPSPSLSASRPSVPMASSMTPGTIWKRSVAVYVTSAWPRTRASRQPPAAIRT